MEFEQLLSFLEDCIANPLGAPLSRLESELARVRPSFINLLDIPPRSAKEKEELEKGFFTVNGEQHRANKDFIDETLFLATTLNASESFCASLLRQGITEQSRFGRASAESGLLVFHGERAALVNCLQALWRGALTTDSRMVDSGVQQVMERETIELTQGKGAALVVDGRKGWVIKIMSAVDNSEDQAAFLRNSLSTQSLPTTTALSFAPAGVPKSKITISDDITEERIRRLDEERHALGQLLFLVATARQLGKPEIVHITTWLTNVSIKDEAAVYILTALLAALDTSDDAAGEAIYPLISDRNFITSLNTLITTKEWQVQPLKATVLLQWTLLLVAGTRFLPNFEADTEIYEEQVENMVVKAVEGGVWGFLGRGVLSYKWDAELEKIWGTVGADVKEVGASVGAWFQEYVTNQIEALVVAFITRMSSVLRKMRNREEDAIFLPRRGGRPGARGEEQPVEIRHDLEALFLLITTIYRDAPDGGLKFWTDTASDSSSAVAGGGSRLTTFIRWGTECRAHGLKTSFYEMIASLSTGLQCAAYAFEFLSLNGGLESSPNEQGPTSAVSWSNLFNALSYYSTQQQTRPGENDGPGEIPPEEIQQLLAFIRVLRQVVAFSDVARATLYDNQRHRPIATLFALLAQPIQIELKASLLGALAAFCRPGGTFGVDVARRTWTALEQSQILPTMAMAQAGAQALGRTVGANAKVPSVGGGILTELEEVEVPNQMFPGSTAFVDLLNALIYTPTPSTSLRRGLEVDCHTIPDNLGAPYRAPGIEPYIHFVIEDMLLKIGEREYMDPKERWSITSKCLTFVENCLVSYDLGPFLASAAVSGQQSMAALTQLVIHPGFDILLRILSGSKLLASILTIVNAGLDALTSNLAGTPLFATCLLRCMRILHRTLELQAPFLEVIVPSLAEWGVTIPYAKLTLLRSVVTLEQHLMYAGDAIVQIALLVSCEEDDHIALLAVQVLAIIADSPTFDVVDRFREASRSKINRLVGLLEASTESLRITQGFARQLEVEVPESELEIGEWDGKGSEGNIRQAIRSAILDLLLQSTQPKRAAPNLAHLLLGFDVHGRPGEMEIDEPSEPDASVTCLHIVLELLALNVPEQDMQDVSPVTLLSRHPTLAAKCYRLVRQLCLHDYTSAALSRYLRNREKFFLAQNKAMPFHVPAASAGALGEVVYADGAHVVTSSSALCAILQSEAWLLESTALELNVLASGKDKQRALALVTTLFGDASVAGERQDVFSRGLEQALPRMLEVFYAFDFTWNDSIVTNESRLRHFADLRFESCLRTDATGCEIYDFTALFALINAARRELQNRGALNTVEQQEEAKLETRAIVENLVVENHRREIQFARYHALRAWRSVLDITLTKALHLLTANGRHSLLLDLMIAILPPIAAQETDQSISELLSGAAVLLMTKLRDEGARLAAAEPDLAPADSPERLHNILTAILQAILQPGVSPVVRGNLYAVFLNYMQYSARLGPSSPASTRLLVEDGSVMGDAATFDGGSTLGGGRRSRRNDLESGNFGILQGTIDRLLPVVCRDAASGHEVWRTVAFTALDALVAAAEEGRAVSKVLSILSKQGYLQSFVASLKDAEADLQEALKPDPESLNALYIYEAQMSFLTRLACTREGSEKLMNAELLSKLAECDYLGARPQSSNSDMDFDGFLPPATERHHQLLLPALQLVVGTLMTFGSDTSVASRQALAFVAGQRETLLIALKECTAVQTLASLQEAHLIVTLLSIVLPSISEEDLLTLSAFGGLHSALLSLSSRICGSRDWLTDVIPSNDAERDDDQISVLALRDAGTIFTDKVQTLAESLQAAILTYQSVATRKRAGTNAFRPLLLPSVQYNERAAGLSAPSLGTAIAFMQDASASLKHRLREMTEVTDKVDKFDSLALEEIEETLNIVHEDGVKTEEKRHRVLQELRVLQQKYRAQVAASLHVIELALLVFWRHVAFFLDPERPESGSSARPEFGLGLADSMRSRGAQSLSTFDAPTLREDIADSYKNVAERLSSLELTPKTVGSSSREREVYIALLLRKLQDLIQA